MLLKEESNQAFEAFMVGEISHAEFCKRLSTITNIVQIISEHYEIE